jgi:hypothetical protein
MNPQYKFDRKIGVPKNMSEGKVKKVSKDIPITGRGGP